jgi:hypothetical protein
LRRVCLPWLVLAGLALGTIAAQQGCSSSSSRAAGSSCGADPATCPSGTTCWPADSVPDLQCLPSNPAAGFGAACTQSIGQATCADGLACDQVGPSSGSCTSYCSATLPCPASYSCRTTQLGTGISAPSIDICRPAALMLDASAVIPPEDGSMGFDVASIPPVDGATDTGPAKQ